MRILSLVICRGDPEEKAAYLLELITQNYYLKTHSKAGNVYEYEISYENTRMLRAFRLILYFSVFLPKKFILNN